MRLIDADALLDSLRESHEGLQKIYDGLHFEIEQRLCGAQITTFIEAILRVKHAPTIDAEPVRHGRWGNVLHDNPGPLEGICSLCGHFCKHAKYYEYCPNCGAKMDGGENDGND